MVLLLVGLTLSVIGDSNRQMQISGTNRLASEKSPYLLQHKDNPVYWYPWGDEAFEAAKKQNKLIFLSIGYSTCYWCHMMEKDSFELQEVADQLNKDFISIKVDREEHPDVDQIYMDAVIGMTGRGGWPMSVFLTPDLKPVFGGTFFWKAQFLELLSRIGQTWKENPDKILAAGSEVMNYLSQRNRTEAAGKINDEPLRSAFHRYKESFDSRHGGFGGAPKFPPSTAISLLLRIHRRSGSEEALRMAIRTLDAMARGGIYDRIGGGFHRYATQDDWNEPHYEKMLYDNALLSWTYLEAFQVTQNKIYAEVVHETLNYVLREMTHPEGGFYSAQDAGEVGKEGEYYHLNKEERVRHEPPHKDDKILTSWNGLMIAAMAKGYQALGEERFLKAAQRGVNFIRSHLYKEKTLMRRYRDGDSRYDGTLDDYAFLIHGLLALYESDFDTGWITWARELQAKQDDLFWDPGEGGYFFSEADDKTLLIRKKETNDGAIPSGNAIAAINLLKLYDLTVDPGYQKKADRLLSLLAGEMQRYPTGFPQTLIAIDYRLDRSKEVVIAGKRGDPATDQFLKYLAGSFNPNKVVAFVDPSKSGARPPLPLLEGKILQNGKTTFYICENQTCRLPTNEWESAKKMMEVLERLEL